MASKEKIFLIEDHHEALAVWQKLKIKDAPLVHLDAHIDFGFYAVQPVLKTFEQARSVADLKRQLELSILYESRKKKFEDQLNIGNYIYPAMRDGIVKSFDWIIPGGNKEFRGSKRILRRMVKGLKARNPQKHPDRLCGKEFKVVCLRAAKKHNSPVLLDIDVDFLLFDAVNKTSLKKNIGKRKPWLYPDELVAQLKKKFPRSLCTTIAYSVNGGFTPILYKFFGDEIALRLNQSRLSRELEGVFNLRNRGIRDCLCGDLRKAAGFFADALTVLKSSRHSERSPEGVVKNLKPGSPDHGFNALFSAHLLLWLSHISWELKEREAARNFYQQAVGWDPTLRTEDNNFGRLYLSARKPQAARAEFERILFCDPLDPHARRGLGDIHFGRKQYKEAKQYYGEVVKLKPDDKKALVGLAECLLRLEDLAGIDALLEKLKQLDPLNGRVLRIEAEICSQRGACQKALRLFKEAVILGPDSPEMYPVIFRLLKVNKDPALLGFFRSRYETLKKRKRTR